MSASPPPPDPSQSETHVAGSETVTRDTGDQPADGGLISTDGERGAAASASDLTPGTRIGEFCIERRLGAGGMGVVYLARDRQLERDVAIKIHRARHGVDRLQREAIAMARLAHPNVITVYEIGRLGDRLFVAMEYVAGQTLRDWMATPRSWREVVAMMRQVGDGLAAAHAAGLVHRDLKPENVLVGSDGRPRVGDFGLARVLGDTTTGDDADPDAASSSAAIQLTATGVVAGTPAYMAPEQFAGAALDARADQFAFAVVLYEALYGQRPFAGGNSTELRRAIEAGQIRDPAPGHHVPSWLRRILVRALAADAAARFPSLRALLDEIARRARRRTIAVVAAVGAVGIAAASALWLATRAGAAPPSCAAAAARLDGVWNDGARAALRARVDPKWADADVASVDRFARRWRTLRTDLCRDGEPAPDSLAARQALCLDEAPGELGRELGRATATVWLGLPWTGRCTSAAPDEHPRVRGLGVNIGTGGLAVLSLDGARIAIAEGAKLSVTDENGDVQRAYALPYVTDYVPELAWSADGKRIFYGAGPALYALDLATGAATPLEVSAMGWISPDGTRLVFEDRDALWLMSLDGRGARRRLADLDGGIAPMSAWSADGKRFAAPIGFEHWPERLRTIAIDGGAVRDEPLRLLRSVTGNQSQVAWLDPRHVTVDGQRTRYEGQGLWVVDAVGGDDGDPPELALEAPPSTAFQVLGSGGGRVLVSRSQMRDRFVRVDGGALRDVPGHSEGSLFVAIDDEGRRALTVPAAFEGDSAWVSLADGTRSPVADSDGKVLWLRGGDHLERVVPAAVGWQLEEQGADGAWRKWLAIPDARGRAPFVVCGGAPAGQCVIVRAGDTAELRAVRGDTLGPPIAIAMPGGAMETNVSVSPDGRRAAVASVGGVTVVDLERGAQEQWPGLADCIHQYPVWSRRDGSLYVGVICGTDYALVHLRSGRPLETIYRGDEWMGTPVVGPDDTIYAMARSYQMDLVLVDGL